MTAPSEITVPQLLRLIGTPDAPAIVDLSIDPDFEADPYLIPGAFRHSHEDPDGLVARLAGSPVVAVCQKGKKLSQGMAALLRTRGLKAEFLSGGNIGWRDNPKAPRLRAAAVPPPVQGRTLWVTRHRPKIDRIACPWLIRRFVDCRADFLFVAPAEVDDVADRFGATPFDVADTFWSHRDGGCTFDTMLDEFGLRTEALNRLAAVICAADTGQLEASAQAPGLLALSVGLSRLYRDDLTQLEAGMALYDALYRWARDGIDESHASLAEESE
ncbi:MAG: sulfurtransferase [Sulfitobacter sp.]|nr:sulfurtransferase [Sulfitobacter sp.]